MLLRCAQNAFKNSTSLAIPEQNQYNNLQMQNQIENNPQFKSHLIDTLSNKYFEDKSQNKKPPSYAQYMDFLASQSDVKEPTTPQNIKSRLEVMMSSPALQNDMISTYLNTISQEQIDKKSKSHGRSA